MKLTDKEYNNLLWQKNRLKNIYDVLVLLFSYIDGKSKKKYRAKYIKFLHMHPGYWEKLELLNNEFLEEMISFPVFIDKFWELLTQENIRYYAFKMLFSYEHYFNEDYKVLKPEIQKSLHCKMSLFGPMNTVQDKYLLYRMPYGHFFKDYNRSRPEKSQIRFMDQNEFDRIDDRIKSYKIIDTNKFSDRVEVVGYSETRYTLPQKLKIALIPVSPCKWFKEIPLSNEDEKYLGINEDEKIGNVVDIVIADDEKYTDSINNAYIHILERCIEENIQIVVFPELAGNRNTLDVVSGFLAQHMANAENSLELIFLGSCSNNVRNEGILLNGSGTELLKVTKKHAYKKVKEGVLYREKLIDFDAEITLIDIPGLGRMQYLICKDGLNTASQNALWSIFEISFSVISAYSESLSHFKNLGSCFSTQYGGIQIVSNACESRMGKYKIEDHPKLELGNVIIPCACANDMSVDKAIQKYETVDYCWNECRKKAKIGSCIRVVSIFPNEESEIKELRMSLDNIIL
ncbi:MAG: hypothetical protein K2O59_16170 [Lachnospiraceae bacterium]|nr:hypothetical protein [Lachnospiraceae bacterium]